MYKSVSYVIVPVFFIVRRSIIWNLKKKRVSFQTANYFGSFNIFKRGDVEYQNQW